MSEHLTGLEIAVIGMTGRFPGAANIDAFWEMLCEGREGVSFFSRRELLEAGAAEEKVGDPRYVNAYGWIDGFDQFDASFFGYSPFETDILDPQVRVFHEVVLEALENAGYDPYGYAKLIGLYAGASGVFHQWQALTELSGKNSIMGWFPAKQLHDKDFLATRVAHRLNLKGPAISIDTACSTSLVAIHLACQGLLSGDCDVALAGGVSFSNHNKRGYIYEEGNLHSPDGHTRTFDVRAKGTCFGNAAAVVVLKRLDDAVIDGDTIYAVVKGSSINNDGDRKAAFTAPSVDGQSQVIHTAHKMAEVEPETIGYVEAHGTATTLGDPVEIEGLKVAFNTDKRHFCRIGAVKSNVGHLEMAAGVTGFIKTVLTLKHRQIPPSLHFETPSPKIDFVNSPFVVNTELRPFEPHGPFPLRAGVSSFGIGGTNAHAVLEEWKEEWADAVLEEADLEPEEFERSETARPHQLLLMSTRCETSLDEASANLAGYFANHKETNLADAAYTLAVGRKIHPCRRMVVCKDTAEAAELLANGNSAKIKTHFSKQDHRPVVFLFPGQGSQYVNMGRGLYEDEPFFRETVDQCLEQLKPLVSFDLKEILFPVKGSAGESEAEGRINRPEVASLAIFIFEYALAQLLIHWGVKPHAVMGYSFGEYTAACVAGIFSPEEALKLVVIRGRAIERGGAGLMLSIPMPKDELLPLLRERNFDDEVFLSIDNGPSCIVAGPEATVRALEAELKGRRIMCMDVPVAGPLHTPLMREAAEELKKAVAGITLKGPEIPFISNVTGDRATEAQVTNPVYWADHLCGTVRFAEGIKRLLADQGTIFLETGPGRDIATLLVRHIEDAEGEEKGSGNYEVLNLVRHPRQDIADSYLLTNRLGRLWLLGQTIDWETYYQREKRRRIPLPTYPFQRQRYYIDPSDLPEGMSGAGSGVEKGLDDYFYVPTWKHMEIPAGNVGPVPEKGNWLIFADERGIGEAAAQRLERAGQQVTCAWKGSMFLDRGANGFTLEPSQENDYVNLLEILKKQDKLPSHILHLWSVGGEAFQPEETGMVEKSLESSYYSLLYLVRGLGKVAPVRPVRLVAVSDGMQEVHGGDGVCPHKAPLLGVVKTTPLEYNHMACRSIDLETSLEPANEVTGVEGAVKFILKETLAQALEQVTAYRGGKRWVQRFERASMEAAAKQALPLKEKGVYLISGGLGGIGLVLAQYLAKEFRARLVLTGRTSLPDRSLWEAILKNPEKSVGEEAPVSQGAMDKLERIGELESFGAEVLPAAVDIADIDAMEDLLDESLERFGPIDGVIHCAGVFDGEMMAVRTKEASENLFAPKIFGTMVLETLMREREEFKPGFFFTCSSITAQLSYLGQVGYCAANSFMDAYANYRYGRTLLSGPDVPGGDGIEAAPTVLAADWDRWRHVGFGTIAEKYHKDFTGEELGGGLTAEQGLESFLRILTNRLPQAAVYTQDLAEAMARAAAPQASEARPAAPSTQLQAPKNLLPRPDMDTDYMAPTNETEEKLSSIWSRFFGLEKVGIQDDFFELGGDSLKALILLPVLHKEMSVEIPITEFFRLPTIQQLAQHIQESDKQDYQSIPLAEPKPHYPVSYIQKRVFVLQEMDEESTAYNNVLAMMVEGDMDIERMERAYKDLIRRHESLRTTFHLIDDEPCQVVHDDAPFKLEIENMEEMGEKILESQEERTRLIREFIRPYDLKKAPLLRVKLLKLAPERHMMLLDIHHIISDGTTIAILTADFAALYHNRSLEPLPLQYKDFSQWLYSDAGIEAVGKQEQYWLNRFKDGVPQLNLKTDFPRPAVQSFEGEQAFLWLEGELKEALENLVKETDSTLYMVLLALSNVLLYKYTGQEDIVIGSPVAGRDRVELEQVVGMFINALLLRNSPTGEKTFVDFLEEVKTSTLEAFSNQGYPFGKLVEKFNVGNDVSRNPLYDFELLVQNIDEPEAETEGLRFIPCTFDPKTAQQDICLEVREVGDRLLCKFIYCTKLFTRETMDGLIGHFQEILKAVTANKATKLKDIRLSLDLSAATNTVLAQDDDSDFGF